MGWISLGLLGMCALVLGLAGTGEDGLRMGIRATARSSLILFSAAFSASALRRLWRVPATKWLLRNRRYVGVSYAVSHAIHALFIVLLAKLHPGDFESNTLGNLFGGGAYLFTAAMVATSSDRAFAWLGARWKELHRVGSYYIWVVFAVTLLPDVASDPSLLDFSLGALVLVPVVLRGLASQSARTSRAQPANP